MAAWTGRMDRANRPALAAGILLLFLLSFAAWFWVEGRVSPNALVLPTICSGVLVLRSLRDKPR
jgi:4-amino-4-deoxy-L-arabinose transferase-like glycosyltransferase